MHIEQAKQFKELGKENLRLTKLVAELSLDNALLQEARQRKLVSQGMTGDLFMLKISFFII